MKKIHKSLYRAFLFLQNTPQMIDIVGILKVVSGILLQWVLLSLCFQHSPLKYGFYSFATFTKSEEIGSRMKFQLIMSSNQLIPINYELQLTFLML